MILKFIKNTIIISSILICSNAYADSIYVEEANNNSKMEVDFNLKLNVDIFQFHGENLTDVQRGINKQLIAFVNENSTYYKDRFNDFIKDVTDGYYTSLGWQNELEIWYDLYSNKENLFSIILYARETGGGGNGCRTSVKGFNFILEKNKTWASNLYSFLKDDESHLKFLKEVNIELAKRESPLVANISNILKNMEFAFAKEEIFICFSAYSVGCGADCIVELRIPYSRIKDLLSTEVLKALKL